MSVALVAGEQMCEEGAQALARMPNDRPSGKPRSLTLQDHPRQQTPPAVWPATMWCCW